jgi:hypothetical protein
LELGSYYRFISDITDMERCALSGFEENLKTGSENNMGGTRKAEFCKNEGCPSSQELYAFQNGDISADDGAPIRMHLRNCEFCTAEVEFYEHYPSQAEITETISIPGPLYELATALLKKDRDDLLEIGDLILN